MKPTEQVPEQERQMAKFLLTVEEAAEMLSLSRRFVYALVMSHKIHTVKLGRARRVPMKSLQAFIDSLS